MLLLNEPGVTTFHRTTKSSTLDLALLDPTTGYWAKEWYILKGELRTGSDHEAIGIKLSKDKRTVD